MKHCGILILVLTIKAFFWVYQKLIHMLFTPLGALDVSDCDCPVPCNEIRYTTEVYYSTFPDTGSAAVMQAEGYTKTSFKHMR